MTSQLGEQAQVARATARFVRVTPMKARRVVDLVRYLPTDEALALLRFAPQSASEPVAKVVTASAELAGKSRKARRETGQSGPATQQGQPRQQSRKAGTRGGTR